MSEISRREFLKQSAAGSAAVAAFVPFATRELQENPLGLPIGSQTWPHRERIKNGDFAGLCRDMAALGIGTIELCSPGYGEFTSLADGKRTRKIIEDHGLTCPSAHVMLEELRHGHEKVIGWAHDVGMTQIGTATLSGKVDHGVAAMDDVKRLADEYNRISEATSKAGMQQFLHDEGFEMAKADGRLVYEVLLELLDPKLVKMQFQMSAMRTVGDPVTYFEKHPGRFISMHLQGVDLNAPLPTAGAPRPPAVAVGKDSLDWKRIFAAAKAGGLKNYFLEQSWDLTVQGVAFLKTLEV
jgi:sugar phosphate isomerase/epimerase